MHKVISKVRLETGYTLSLENQNTLCLQSESVTLKLTVKQFHINWPQTVRGKLINCNKQHNLYDMYKNRTKACLPTETCNREGTDEGREERRVWERLGNQGISRNLQVYLFTWNKIVIIVPTLPHQSQSTLIIFLVYS